MRARHVVTKRRCGRAAVTSGVAVLGLMSAGPALAATGGTPVSTPDVGAVVNGTTSGLTSTLGLPTSGATSTPDPAAGLPKPVKQVVNTAEDAAGKATSTVKQMLNTLTGQPSGSSKPKSKSGSHRTKTTTSGRHQDSRHTTSSTGPLRHRHAGSTRGEGQGGQAADIPAIIPQVSSTHLTLAGGSGRAPAVAGRPAVAPAKPTAHRSSNGNSDLPALPRDNTLQLELLAIAAALAGAVAAGHVWVARRRLTSAVLHSTSQPVGRPAASLG